MKPTPEMLSEAEQTWVRVLAQELYGQSAAEIQTALKDKHPPRVIGAVIREAGGR